MSYEQNAPPASTTLRGTVSPRARIGLVIEKRETSAAISAIAEAETVRQQLLSLLAQGLDELIVLLAPVQNATQEQAQLVRVIGGIG